MQYYQNARIVNIDVVFKSNNKDQMKKNYQSLACHIEGNKKIDPTPKNWKLNWLGH